MKAKNILILPLFIFFMFNKGIAQHPEGLFVQFNKPFYVVGDIAWYSIHFVENQEFANAIVKVELIGSNSQLLISQKLKKVTPIAKGDFQIPYDWKEGFYLFRAFAISNLDSDTTFFYQKQIAIYNDFDKKVNESPRSLIAPSLAFMPLEKGVRVVLNKVKYKTREQVMGNLSLLDSTDAVFLGNVSVTVLPQNTPYFNEYLDYEQNRCDYFVAPVAVKSAVKNLESAPVLMIEGSVKDPITQKPVNDKYLSLYLKGNNTFQRLSSDAEGNFKATLPDFYDTSPIQVISLNPNRTYPLSIELKKQLTSFNFKTNQNPLRTPELDYYIYWYAKKRQIDDIFNMKNVSLDSVFSEIKLKPDRRFDIKNYVDLGSVETFLDEAFLSVRKLKTSQGMTLRLFSYDDKQYKTLPPFYRLNGLFVQSEADIMALKSANLERIDVFERPESVKAQFDTLMFRYGVIDLVSLPAFKNNKKNETYFVEIEGFYKPKNWTAPFWAAYETPDLRTNLYWNPSINLKKGIADFSFLTSDVPQSYIVTVMGTNQDGKPVFATTHFVVEQ